MTFSLCQLCGTIIRFIFYKCDLLPNLTHLELQTAEFGQNLAKRAKFFVFGLMVFSFYHLLGHHIRFHLVRITFSSDSYCDLQHISNVYLFRTLTHYSSLPNNRVYTAIYFPKFSLVHALIKDVHDYLFSSFCMKK